MKLDKELTKDIDKILNLLFDNGHTSLNNQSNDLRRKSINICKSLNLIRNKSGTLFELDEKGVFAIQDGGIEKYLSNIRTEKDLELI